MKEDTEDDQDPIDDDKSDLKSFEEMTISEKKDFINDLRNGYNPNLDTDLNQDDSDDNVVEPQEEPDVESEDDQAGEITAKDSEEELVEEPEDEPDDDESDLSPAELAARGRAEMEEARAEAEKWAAENGMDYWSDGTPMADDNYNLKSFEEMTISEKRDFINDLRNGHNPNLDNQTNDVADLGNEDSSIENQNDVADEKLKEVERPILVGGTGMYINALINGLSPIPDVDPVIRETVRSMSIDDVKKQVKECSVIDPQRLRRALEIQLSTGKSLSYFQNLPKIKLLDANFNVFFVNPERDVLYHNCNQRLLQMINNGAIEEVRHLLNIQATGGVLKAIGVPEIIDYLSGKVSFERMVQQIQLSTRHYAKRQVTWFKNQLPDVCEIKNPIDFVFTE